MFSVSLYLLKKNVCTSCGLSHSLHYFSPLDFFKEDDKLVGYICELLRYRTGGEFSETLIHDLEEGPRLSFVDACVLLRDTMKDAGWLDEARHYEQARIAIQNALKDCPERMEEALRSLDG